MATRGELFELRVARLLHAEGALVRRRVNVDSEVGERSVQVTDLDVLAFNFDQSLALRLATGECKTAETKNAPSTKDRLLWLAGVSRLVAADDGFLATIRGVRDPDRRFARTLDLDIVDPSNLARREAILGLDPESGFSSHSPDAVALAATVERVVKNDDELRRVYFFVRGELWLAEPVVVLKRALGACRVLAGRYRDNLPADEERVLRWLATEALVGLVLALVRLAGECYREPEEVFARHLSERLAEGLASYSAMRQISKEVDRFLVGVLKEAGVDNSRVVGAIGALAPRVPAYAEPLLEVVQRLAAQPRLTRELPRLAESHLAHDLYGEELPSPEHEAAPLLRIVAVFAERQGRLPAELLGSLTRRTGAPTPAPARRNDKNDAGGGETAADETASGGPVAGEATAETGDAGQVDERLFSEQA